MVSLRGFLRWSRWEASGLVVPGGVEDELADQLAGVAADDADVQVVDEQSDVGAAGGSAEADVVQSAVVAQGDGAAGVDGVVADPVVGGDLDAGGDRFGPVRVGLGGGAPTDRPVRPGGVVVGGEPVQLALQRPDRGRRGLGREPLLLGLVEPLHLAAGLGMVGPGMIEPHAEDTEFDLQRDPALTALFGGEHCTVVAEYLGRDSPPGKGFAEAGHHIVAGGVAAGVAAQTGPGVVVDNVQDRDLRTVGQLPVGDVGLPAFVGLLGAKRSPRRPRPSLGLGADEAATRQDPPDRRDGRYRRPAAAGWGLARQVSRDGFRARVQSLLRQLLAQPNDRILSIGINRLRTGMRPPGSGSNAASPSASKRWR